MALRTDTAVTPAPGADWTYVVPGQYVEKLVGVTARLAPSTFAGYVAPDLSGNGNDGTYESGGITPLAFGADLTPGAVALALDLNNGAPGPATNVSIPVFTTTFANPYSVVAWFSSATAVTPDIFVYGSSRPGARQVVVRLRFSVNLLVVSSDFGTSWEADLTGYDDNNPHFVAVTWDGATLVAYLDGVAVPWLSTGTATGPYGAATRAFFGSDIGNFVSAGELGQVGLFASTLSAGDVTALKLAGDTSASSYQTTIVALSPTVYYVLNDQLTLANRTPILEAGDGVRVTAQFPPQAIAAPAGNLFFWSWQSGLQFPATGSGGPVNTVAIAPLVLQPGFTLATFTPDLGPGDQWSDVVIWWDDALMAQGPAGPQGGGVIYENWLLLG